MSAPRCGFHGLVPSDACLTCRALQMYYEARATPAARAESKREETQRAFDRRVHRIIAIEIAVALLLFAALIVAWFLAASPARADAHRDSTQLGASGYVSAAALRAALAARAKLDGGAVRWADGSPVASVADAGLRASRSDGGAL